MKNKYVFYIFIFSIVGIVFGIEILTNTLPKLKNNFYKNSAFFWYVVVIIPLIIMLFLKYSNFFERKEYSNIILKVLGNNILVVLLTISFLIFLFLESALKLL